MNRSSRSVALACVAVASWSTVATAFKIALSQLTVYQTIFIATLTALVIFSLWQTFSRGWGELRRLSPSGWLGLALLGAVNPVAYYMVLFRAYELLPAQIAQPLNYAWPVMLLVLLVIVRREAIPGCKYVGMAISLAGVVAVSSGGGGTAGGNLSASGMALAGGSALLWASYWLIADSFSRKGVSQPTVMFGGFLFGAVWLALMLLAPSSPEMPLGIGTMGIPSAQALAAGVYVGCFEIGIPFICFGMALHMSPNPALVNQLCFLSPFLSLALIALVLGEPIALSTVAGLLLITGGLFFNQIADSRIREADQKSNAV